MKKASLPAIGGTGFFIGMDYSVFLIGTDCSEKSKNLSERGRIQIGCRIKAGKNSL